MKNKSCCILLLLLLCQAVGCSPADEFVLFDFETDEEMDIIDWNCRTLFYRTQEFVSHGSNSLKFEMFPADIYLEPFSGFVLPMNLIRGSGRDWRPYRSFNFDIYNPDNITRRFYIRFDDLPIDAPDSERCYIHLNLESGWNHIAIPLEKLIAHGTKRPLNKKNMRRVTLFTHKPQTHFILYFDFFRLVR